MPNLKDVKCPFFISSDERSITCEGIFSDKIINSFDDNTKSDLWADVFCRCDYAQCDIAKLQTQLKERDKKWL